MKALCALSLPAIAVFAGCAHIVHVPPGTSVELALARKPEVLKVPEVAPTPSEGPQIATNRKPYIPPPVEPTLPTNDSVTAAAEAYTRGRMAMDENRMDDAIVAFQQAVQADPQFNEAWQSLAMAYEKAGKMDKAKEAFRNAKNFAKH